MTLRHISTRAFSGFSVNQIMLNGVARFCAKITTKDRFRFQFLYGLIWINDSVESRTNPQANKDDSLCVLTTSTLAVGCRRHHPGRRLRTKLKRGDLASPLSLFVDCKPVATEGTHGWWPDVHDSITMPRSPRSSSRRHFHRDGPWEMMGYFFLDDCGRRLDSLTTYKKRCVFHFVR